MSLKLKDALFETNEKNLYKIFEKADKRELEGNVQALNKQKLQAVVKAIATSLNNKLPDTETVKLKDVMKSPLGVFGFNDIKALSNVPIALGLKIDPVNIKGDQSQGIDPLSFKAADTFDIMPIQIVNKFGEAIGGNVKGNEMIGIAYFPAIMKPLDNPEFHVKRFGLKPPEKGNTLMHMKVPLDIPVELVTKEEFEEIQKAFLTGKEAVINRISNLQKSRISGGVPEQAGQSDVAMSKNKRKTSADNKDASSNEDKDIDNKTDSIEKPDKMPEAFNFSTGKKLHEHSLSSLLLESQDEDPVTEPAAKLDKGGAQAEIVPQRVEFMLKDFPGVTIEQMFSVGSDIFAGDEKIRKAGVAGVIDDNIEQKLDSYFDSMSSFQLACFYLYLEAIGEMDEFNATANQTVWKNYINNNFGGSIENMVTAFKSNPESLDLKQNGITKDELVALFDDLKQPEVQVATHIDNSVSGDSKGSATDPFSEDLDSLFDIIDVDGVDGWSNMDPDEQIDAVSSNLSGSQLQQVLNTAEENTGNEMTIQALTNADAPFCNLVVGNEKESDEKSSILFFQSIQMSPKGRRKKNIVFIILFKDNGGYEFLRKDHKFDTYKEIIDNLADCALYDISKNKEPDVLSILSRIKELDATEGKQTITKTLQDEFNIDIEHLESQDDDKGQEKPDEIQQASSKVPNAPSEEEQKAYEGFQDIFSANRYDNNLSTAQNNISKVQDTEQKIPDKIKSKIDQIDKLSGVDQNDIKNVGALLNAKSDLCRTMSTVMDDVEDCAKNLSKLVKFKPKISEEGEERKFVPKYRTKSFVAGLDYVKKVANLVEETFNAMGISEFLSQESESQNTVAMLNNSARPIVKSILDFKYKDNKRSYSQFSQWSKTYKISTRVNDQWEKKTGDDVKNSIQYLIEELVKAFKKGSAQIEKELNNAIEDFSKENAEALSKVEQGAFNWREGLKYDIDKIYKPFSKISGIDITYETFESYFDSFVEQAQERVETSKKEFDPSILEKPLVLDLDAVIGELEKVNIKDESINDLAIILARNFIEIDDKKRQQLTAVEAQRYFVESFYEALDIQGKSGRFLENANKKGEPLNEIVGVAAGAVASAALFCGVTLGTSIVIIALAGYGIGQITGFDDWIKRKLSKKVLKKQDVVEAIMDNDEMVAAYKKLIKVSLLKAAQEYFISLESSLEEKFNIKLKYSNQKEYRAVKTRQQEEKKSAKAIENMSDFGKELMTKIEDVGHDVLPSMPGSQHFSDVTVTRVNSALRESKHINMIINHLSDGNTAGQENAGFVYQKGLGQLILKESEENSVSSKKEQINIPVNKMFGELKRLIGQSISKTNYNEKILRDLEKDFIKYGNENSSKISITKAENKTIPVSFVVQKISAYTGIPQAKIKKQLFESKNRNSNLINYNNKKNIENLINENILSGSLANLLLEESSVVSHVSSAGQYSRDGRFYFENLQSKGSDGVEKYDYYVTDFAKSIKRPTIKFDLNDVGIVPSKGSQFTISSEDGADPTPFVRFSVEHNGVKKVLRFRADGIASDFDKDVKIFLKLKNMDAAERMRYSDQISKISNRLGNLKGKIDPNGKITITSDGENVGIIKNVKEFKTPPISRTNKLTEDRFNDMIESTSAKGEIYLSASENLQAKHDQFLLHKLGGERSDYVVKKGLAIPKEHMLEGEIQWGDSDVIEGVKAFKTNGEFVEIKIAAGSTSGEIVTISPDGVELASRSRVIELRDKLVGNPVKFKTTGDTISDNGLVSSKLEMSAKAKETLGSAGTEVGEQAGAEAGAEAGSEAGSEAGEQAAGEQAGEQVDTEIKDVKSNDSNIDIFKDDKVDSIDQDALDEIYKDHMRTDSGGNIRLDAQHLDDDFEKLGYKVDTSNSVGEIKLYRIDSDGNASSEVIETFENSPDGVKDLCQKINDLKGQSNISLEVKEINMETKTLTKIDPESEGFFAGAKKFYNDLFDSSSSVTDKTLSNIAISKGPPMTGPDAEAFQNLFNADGFESAKVFELKGGGGIIDFGNGKVIASPTIENLKEQYGIIAQNNFDFKVAMAKEFGKEYATVSSGAEVVEPTLGEALVGKIGAWLPIIPLALYGYKTFKSIQSAKKDVIIKAMLDSIKAESDIGFFNISASVPLAYKICKLLEENKQTLKENGINIVGSLGQEKAGTTGMGSQKLASSKLVSSLKQQLRTSTSGPFKKWRGQSKASGVNADSITDDQIAQAINGGLTQICVGLLKIYDKERYKETVKTADKESYSKEASKWFKSKNYDNVINRIGGEEVSSNREKMLQKNVSKEVELLSNFIIGLNRDSKGLGESFYKNKLKNLLFETGFLTEVSNKTIIDVKELKSGLRSSGVAVYSSGLKPDSKDFVEGENYLVGTLADFLYTNFDIEVKGVEEYQKLNLTKVAVEADVDQDAKVGESASKELEAVVGNGPVAQNMNAPMDLNQLAGLINMSGGNNALLLILLLSQQPQLLQALVALQGKGGASLLDGLNLIKQEAPEDAKEKLEGIDRDIEQALEYQNNSKPNMSKKDVKRLYKLLNADPLSKLSNQNIISGSKINIKDSSMFVANLRRYFNITDGNVGYSDDDVFKLFNFMLGVNGFYDTENLKASNDEGYYKHDSNKVIDNSEQEIMYITTCAGLYLAAKFLRLDHDSIIKTYIMKAIAGTDDDKNTFYSKLNQGNNVIFTSLDIPELTAENKFRKSKVITRKPKKLKVIEEAKFLEQEFKRLWNLR